MRLAFTAFLFLGAAFVDVRAEGLPMEPARTLSFETDEGTWISLDISPDGETIVFDLLGDIYLLAVKGGKARQLTSGMAFDTQPVFSPDGKKIAFVTDASGAENIWVIGLDGTGAKQISFQDTDRAYFSPEWSWNGEHIYVSLFRADVQGHALWAYKADGSGSFEELVGVKTPNGPQSVSGVSPSKDGKYLYFAHLDGTLSFEQSNKWTIKRRELATGKEDTLAAAVPSRLADPDGGSYFRPALSPNGQYLVYGTRYKGQTGLRLRQLGTGNDTWLAYPIQHDQLQASHVQDIMPGYSFTPDGLALIFFDKGQINRLELTTGEKKVIPFKASVSLGLGPSLRQDIAEKTGPVEARLIQNPEQSPDGQRLVFSALGKLYSMVLNQGVKETSAVIYDGEVPAFHPSWSPDGTLITFVTWSAKGAGHAWLMPADGSKPPKKLTNVSDFYSYPVFSPDGQFVYVSRASHYARMRSYFEYGILRDASLLKVAVSGGRPTVVYEGKFGAKPHFSKQGNYIHVMMPDGLMAVSLKDNSAQKPMQVVARNWYFLEGQGPVDSLKVSPDGKWALAHTAQQLYLLNLVDKRAGQQIDLADPSVPYSRITDVGADFYDWAEGGHIIAWSIGSSYYRRPLNQVTLFNPAEEKRGIDVPATGQKGMEVFHANVTVPRDIPEGALLLKGATVVTMGEKGLLQKADLLVVNNRIAALGPESSLRVPEGADVIDMSGKFIIPGLIDTHHHVADIRRDIVDLDAWGPRATLAYGITSLFDPSTLSIDMMIYSDLLDAGLMTGSRIYSTGPALFSFNDFQSKSEVRQVLLRYRDHYGLRNLKMYKTGNRRVRQWFAEAAFELGMMPTTEGGLNMKLGLTQVIDGYAGHEHALPVSPIYRDVIELMSKSGVGYNTTLMITNGSYEGQEYFITRDNPSEDPRLNRFWPRLMANGKFYEQKWRHHSLYQFPETASDAAKILRAGGLLGIGAHGEAPGIGTHWEMEAHVMGGMTPFEVLQSATIGGARVIGRSQDIGSLDVGKLADLVVLDKNPLENIRNARSISMVMKNGRLYEADTLQESWPDKGVTPAPWFIEEQP